MKEPSEALLEAACAIAHRGIFVRLVPVGDVLELQVRSGDRTLLIQSNRTWHRLYDVLDQKLGPLGEQVGLNSMVEFICRELALQPHGVRGG